MARPETHADLPDYERAGHRVAHIEAEYVVKFPSLGQHLIAALAEADRLGLVVDAGLISLPRTTDELDQSLATAQSQWDRSEERYRQALADPEAIEPGVWRKITNDWARANGLREIAWDAATVSY